MTELKLIYIVGSSRSGTTMMNRVLGRNQDVCALNELHYLGEIWEMASPLIDLSKEHAIKSAALLVKRIRRGLWDGGVERNELEVARELIETRSSWTHRDIYLAVLKQECAETSGYITDQTPRNVFFVDYILEYFPNARIIHMVRDPRAVLASQRNRWKKRWLGARTMPIRNVLRVLVNYHPYTITKLWKKALEVAERHKGESRYKVVLFENMVRDPELEIGKICEFLGVAFDRAMLEIPQVGSSNKMHDSEKMGISVDVIDAWRNILPRGDVVVCEAIASELMTKMGYQRVSVSAWWLFSIWPLLRFPFHVVGAILLNPKVLANYVRSLVRLR